MRRIAMLGLLLVLGSGCGRGWLPGLNHGAPCNGACGVGGTALPPPINAGAGCNGCGTTTSGYGTYGSDVVSGDYYGGEVLSGDYYGGTVTNGVITDGAIVSPSMAPIPAS